MKQQFIKDTVDTFQTYIYENNRKIAAGPATLTVYRPGGDSKLIDAAPMTAGSDGLLSYSLTQEENSAAAVNYRAVVSYSYNGKTCYATLFYDVVNSRLSKVITDEDIFGELPQLKDSGWSVRGEAEGGSETTLVDSELKRYEDDYFTGGLLYSMDRDEAREVADFSSSTGTITSESFSSAIIPGERYILTRSFSKEIQRAFEKIEERLMRLGRRPELVLDPYDLREVHICFSVAEACKGLARESGGFWWEMWKEYEKKAEEAFKDMNFKYDSSEDGSVSGGEEGAGTATLRMGRR
ncbi:MAG: hypothetical protein HY893_03620 [Deltaproteobacteria bacterium]|nr:hypothetical protein [Deltaproteobacteria bacterium]